MVLMFITFLYIRSPHLYLNIMVVLLPWVKPPKLRVKHLKIERLPCNSTVTLIPWHRPLTFPYFVHMVHMVFEFPWVVPNIPNTSRFSVAPLGIFFVISFLKVFGYGYKFGGGCNFGDGSACCYTWGLIYELGVACIVDLSQHSSFCCAISPFQWCRQNSFCQSLAILGIQCNHCKLCLEFWIHLPLSNQIMI